MMMAQAELPTTKVAPTSLDQPQPELDSFHVSSFSDSDSSVDETEVEADAPLLPEANASCLAEQLWEPFRSLVMNPLTTLVVCLCVNAAFILTWTFLAWLAHLITRPGLFVLVVALVVCIARLAALVLSYPGHLQVVARDCERSFALMIKKWVRLTADTTDELIQDYQLLLSPEPCTPEATTAFREVYTSFESCLTNIMVVLQRSLEIVDEEETLTTDGKRVLAHIRVYLEYAEKLRPSFAQLAADTTPNMEALRQQLDLDKPLVEFGMCVQDLRDVIECVGEPPGTPKRSGLWGLLCELVLARLRPLHIVASLSLMRADLIARHNGRQVWVPGYERNRIDGMFIPGLGLPIQNAERTVILCNPNCGLYEFHHFQSDWIQFYTKLGINVFLFNYRGYGRTKGYPSPHANNLDGMAVAAYLRNDKSIQRLAIHGESIGGMVATHVAKHADGIELLIADRTFANLPAVAQRLVASWAGRALSCVTRWQTDNVTNYLDATCHKVVCCDPCDEIIADGSSLKAGIALRLELGDLQAQTPKARPAAPRRLAACAPVGYEAVSELSTEVVIGKPLTEAIVAKFARHLLRIADRAKDAMELEMTDATVIDVDDAGHAKDLIALWSAIASLDGHCGQTLFYAAGSGLEGIRAWTTSFIVWGPSTRLAAVPVARRPHDFVTPLPIEHVRVLLQRVQSAAAWLTTDVDASYVMDIMEYLYASMQARSAKATDDAMLGALVPLSCGHNANFSEQEKQALLAHLVAYKWAEASSAEDESSK
ncbi:hypothetical protein SPRG_07008 [Saprolegnia parasitica CBS 223.65]|uniref:AB hydrolase-1 domain-containing protein n=1 Tax=Saprolegnia parasitica (strain CBS 223.65) TaxID=695850 RepID=A0A067CE07_SAPPC|nr:hypothetical protein SPRG_07008 [Saprolegnia parasitica CBS 223.65]KDO27420.1 hypothetical protein SPRG_07008 [Saprolegnia parasitica CBS 223.65]|eukprot:XP_012201860.1 hypothetical protein SPRG_07008 [Saprolegnia parasitica CBS 223.65]